MDQFLDQFLISFWISLRLSIRWVEESELEELLPDVEWCCALPFQSTLARTLGCGYRMLRHAVVHRSCLLS
jgi:hypothetical protein